MLQGQWGRPLTPYIPRKKRAGVATPRLPLLNGQGIIFGGHIYIALEVPACTIKQTLIKTTRSRDLGLI